MRVLVDDVDCRTGAGSLSEAVDEVAAQLRGRGRIIVEVEVDGHRCVGAELDRLLAARSTPDEVRLTTARSAGQVAESLAAAGLELGRAAQLQEDAARLIESGDTTEGMHVLSKAFTIWSEVQRTIALGTDLVELDLDRLTVGQTPARTLIADFDARLREMAAALQRRDPVGLSDTLLYDMPGITRQWRDMLGQLQRRLEKGIS